jgi:hypothetical protein
MSSLAQLAFPLSHLHLKLLQAVDKALHDGARHIGGDEQRA